VTRNQTFAYTAAGDVSTATHHAKATTYSYSPAGWLTSMTDWRNKTTSLTYQPSGAPKTQAVGGAANGTFTYHPDGSVKDLTWKATGLGTPTVRAHTGLTYDEGGLRTAENVAVAWPLGTFKSTATHQGTYSYDLLDRLVGWQSPFEEDTTVHQPVTTQTLDDGGNATAETVKAGTATRSTSTSTFPNGRLATKATTAETTTTNETFSYNGLGEETSRVGATGTTTTAYDPMGHSSRVDQPGGATDVDYVYDTADRLISRTETVPGGTPRTTLFFYWAVGGSLAEETSDTGATKVRYLVDSDQEAIGQEKVNGSSTTFAWMLPDTAGNPATYTGDSGGVIEQAAFDPYGKPDKGGQAKDLSGGATPTLGFQGAITDKATGNVVLGARLYDPTTARFTTPDTFIAGALDLELGTDSLTGNRYLFAAANPVSFYEDGHWGWPKVKLPNPIKTLKKVAKKAVPALAFVPVVGTGIDVVSAATGRDLLNGGRKLSGAERALMLTGAAAGLVPGAGTAAKAALKTATKSVVKAKSAAKVAVAAGAHVDEAKEAFTAWKKTKLAADRADFRSVSRDIMGSGPRPTRATELAPGRFFTERIELHHRFVPQRAWWAPSSIKNARWNLQKVWTLDHARADKYRYQFLPRWVKGHVQAPRR
jgi:RHS repeat-associated protein